MNSVGTLGNAALTSRATYAKFWPRAMRPSSTDTTVTTACTHPRPDPPESKNCPRSAQPSAGDGATGASGRRCWSMRALTLGTTHAVASFKSVSMRDIGRPAPSPPPPAPLGIIAIVTRSHTAGHCCDMMYLFTKSKQISRCASDMARR